MDIWGGKIMTAKKKQVMSWTLRIQNDDYRHDYEQYGNKITSIGLHEWDVDASGKIAIYKLNPTKDADGYYTSYTDATTYDRYAPGRLLFPNYVEPDMKRWPHIEYYMQMVIFGPETVSRLLDSTTAQDNFISNLKKVVTLFRKDQNGNDLGYTGIEVDCEGSWSDSKWDARVGDDDKYIALLKRIKDEVIIDANPDFKFRINAHAMWGAGVPDYYRFHNYQKFAETKDKNGNAMLDEVQIMTYDFSWSGSAPGPSTPLWWMEDVATWAQKCFDPTYNPKAVCTIDQVYLGGAGYGRRWPIFTEDTYGSSVTYRNMVDWQNGYYMHYLGNGEMADQDFIPQNAFNDPNSDNQIMYNHQYDYYKGKHLKKNTSLGQTTARDSSYNGVEYVTAYSKNQHMKVTGFKACTGVLGVSEPTHNLTITNDSTSDKNPKRPETLTVPLGGTDYVFQGYTTVRVPYEPVKDANGNQYCAKRDQPETLLTYTLNAPTAGSYRMVAVVSFPFYGWTKLGGYVNGSTEFKIGGDLIPDYYPMMFKGGHVWDMGTFDLNAGANTIVVDGTKSIPGTVIMGFFICDSVELEVIGGYLNATPEIRQYKRRDGSPAKAPENLVFTNETLQQSPRPVIMWEDYFSQYVSDTAVQGTSLQESEKNPKTAGLTAITYYKYAGVKQDIGGGTEEQWDGDFNKTSGTALTACYASVDNGFSQGFWGVESTDGVAYARFKPGDPKNGDVTSGQLVLNYTYQVTNISAECQFKAMSGNRAGVRFASTGPGTGYIFAIDYSTQIVSLFYEELGVATKTLASVSLGDRVASYGERMTMRVRVNNGMARCYISNGNWAINPFGADIAVPDMQPGGMGCYATNCDLYLYMVSFGTTERWETLERLSLIVDGTEYKLGEINRPGYNRDSWGYLMYSGFNEVETREITGYDSSGNPIRPSISLDYVFKPVTVPTLSEGETALPVRKDVQVKLTDAGLWYKMLYIGDAEGMSIMYTGDAESFNKAMNIAVYDYNCKGIGLWVLGQADPRIYEVLPDVVPWHE
jgi:spore germination protein YaaH